MPRHVAPRGKLGTMVSVGVRFRRVNAVFNCEIDDKSCSRGRVGLALYYQTKNQFKWTLKVISEQLLTLCSKRDRTDSDWSGRIWQPARLVGLQAARSKRFGSISVRSTTNSAIQSALDWLYKATKKINLLKFKNWIWPNLHFVFNRSQNRSRFHSFYDRWHISSRIPVKPKSPKIKTFN